MNDTQSRAEEAARISFREIFPAMQEAKTAEEAIDLRLAFWNECDDIDRALNWSLWFAPLPSNYWKDTEDGEAIEPLEFYTWNGFEAAGKRLEELMGQLLGEVWYDEDGCVYEIDPYEYDLHWEADPDDETEDGTWVYTGPEIYYNETVPKLILHKEVANQFF